MPLPKNLKGSRWTPKVARAIFPWLIWLAKNHRTIFYSEIDEELVRRRIHKHVNYVQYGHPAGAVGNALAEIGEEWGEVIPPVNALIINKSGPRKGMPGDGCDWYLTHFLEREVDFKILPVEDQRAIVAEVHEAIFAYKKWDKVQSYFSDVTRRYPELARFDGRFLAVFRATAPSPSVKPSSVPWNFVPPPKFHEPRKPESSAHRALKEYIAEHPECVGLPRKSKADLEKVFGSGDRADLAFTIGEKIVVAEVKSEISDNADLCRGVFQCIKYRALVGAHQKLKRVIPNGEAILAIGKAAPAKVAPLADALSVTCVDRIAVPKQRPRTSERPSAGLSA